MTKTHKPHSLKKIRQFLDEMDWMFETKNWISSIGVAETQPDDRPGLTAEIMPDMVYREIHLKLYPRFWKLDADDQRKALLHELTHVLLQNTKLFAVDLLHGVLHTAQEIKDENERTTTRITHLLSQLLLGRLRYAKKAYARYGKGK